MTPVSDPFPADIAVGPPIGGMSRAEIMVELQGYKPRTAKDVRTDEPWLERRRRLWRRLDAWTATR